MSGSAAETVLLLLWLLALSASDLRRGTVSARLLAAGGAAGLLLRIMDAVSGTPAGTLFARHLPGLAAGALLLAAARITREAVGYGDGLCFGILAFWLPWEELYTLLLTSLLLCGVTGFLAGLVRKKRVKTLPFLPFVAGACLALRLAGHIGGALP